MKYLMTLSNQSGYDVTVDQMREILVKLNLYWKDVDQSIVFVVEDDEIGSEIDAICRELDDPNIGVIDLHQMCDSIQLY